MRMWYRVSDSTSLLVFKLKTTKSDDVLMELFRYVLFLMVSCRVLKITMLKHLLQNYKLDMKIHLIGLRIAAVSQSHSVYSLIWLRWSTYSYFVSSLVAVVVVEWRRQRRAASIVGGRALRFSIVSSKNKC